MLALPLALGGCGLLDGLFADPKPKLAGKREPVLGGRGSPLEITDTRPIAVPPPAPMPNWPENGGSPTHAVGNVAISGLSPAWSTSIGDGGGYRTKLTAQPVVLDGTVYTMDSDGRIAAIDLQTGNRRWRVDTQGDEDRSSNLGGGIAVEGKVIYATTGRAEALALSTADGTVLWRKGIGVPARSGPTLAGGRMHFTTLDNQLVALTTQNGTRAWSFSGSAPTTTVLADASPAISDGFVIAGFGSGELVTLRAESGAQVWSDSLAAGAGQNSLLDLTAIRALPVVADGRVYAIGVGGLLVALDLRTGRRLWEREIGGGQTPCLAGDWLFVQSSNQSLAAINSADGRVRWVQPLPRWANPAKQSDPIYWTGPLMAGSKLILAGSTEQAVSIEPTTGRILGTQALSSSVSVAPLAVAGTALVLCDDGTLQAFR